MFLQNCNGYAIHSGESADSLPFQVYTDDGRGNGDFCAEFITLDNAVTFCNTYPFDSDGYRAELDEAAESHDDYGDHDYSMNA